MQQTAEQEAPEPALTKTAMLMRDLETKVSELRSGDDWKALLRFQARFHTYSFGNMLLILNQRPSATRVAGFHTWRRLGRTVKKGEKGIAILAPVGSRERSSATASLGAPSTAPARAEDGTTDSEESATTGARRAAFRLVHVFDVAQTEGDELPSGGAAMSAAVLSGRGTADEAALLASLTQVSEAVLHIPVEIRPLAAGIHGMLDRAERRISLREGNPTLQLAKTLAHELGHALLHLTEHDSHARPVMEVEAESVAYVVLAHLGFDTSAYSFGYVAGWCGGDTKLIRQAGERVARAAAKVLAALESLAPVAA